MVFFLENAPLSRWTGGENGLPGVPTPMIGGWRISIGLPMAGLMGLVFVAGYGFARRLVASPFGAVLRAIKENTARAAMLGHAVGRYKLAVLVIAALYAGLAGGLLGVLQSYMPPDAFSLDTSGQLVVQSVIGGVGTLVGPLVGAIVWLYLHDLLQTVPGIGALWKFCLALIFILLMIGLRRGICGAAFAVWQRRRASVAAPTMQHLGVTLKLEAPPPRTGVAALEARSLCKHYGGLRAVDGVSFSVRAGSVHAVIGPNGAGKSTLFKMLLDEIQPTSGEVRLFGRPISGLGVTATCQLGMAKSNQLNQLFESLTVRQNLRIAALARRRGAFRMDVLRRADGVGVVEDQIWSVLATIGLAHRAETPVHSLAYGEKRRLEVGLALASGPLVMLLDEPLAGMSPAERVDMRALVRALAHSRTVLIVEHDMDAVFDLADRITVLYEGRLLAEGNAELIQRDQAVQDAYLGGLHENEPA
jgi:branched-chain amino acid transport system permease protein